MLLSTSTTQTGCAVLTLKVEGSVNFGNLEAVGGLGARMSLTRIGLSLLTAIDFPIWGGIRP